MMVTNLQIARFSVRYSLMVNGKVGAMRMNSPSQLAPLISEVRVLQWEYTFNINQYVFI